MLVNWQTHQAVPFNIYQVDGSLVAALQAEADRCEQAKERLFAATTPEEVDVARQVMEIMCND